MMEAAKGVLYLFNICPVSIYLSIFLFLAISFFNDPRNQSILGSCDTYINNTPQADDNNIWQSIQKRTSRDTHLIKWEMRESARIQIHRIFIFYFLLTLDTTSYSTTRTVTVTTYLKDTDHYPPTTSTLQSST